MTALDFSKKSDPEHALLNFRKSGEACLKILIIEKYGDANGEQIIKGEIDTQLNTLPSPRDLDHQELLDIVRNDRLSTLGMLSRLIDLQQRTSPYAHNLNSPADFASDQRLCISQSNELTKYIYKKLGEQLPVDLSAAYTGNISSTQIRELAGSPLEDLFDYTDQFSKLQKYILISPPEFSASAAANLKALSRLDWSFVLDFDPKSKETGLYSIFDRIGDNSFVPLNIKQRGQRNLVGSGLYKNINYMFANGLKTLPDTTAANVKAWRNMRYHIFLKDLFTDFFGKEVSRYVIVYLWDDLEFIEEVARVIAEIDEIPSDLVKHVFLTQDESTLEGIAKFEKLDLDFQIFNLSAEQLLNGIHSVIPETASGRSGIIVPARTKLDENALVDISDIHQRLLDNQITTVHSQIEHNGVSLIGDHTPPFFEGEQITWKDLSVNIEAERHKYNELHQKLSEHLANTKKSLKFELLHKPGAGGTTLAARVAFDLKSRYPVVMINGFDKANTYQALNLFLDRVNQTTLAVVEASVVGLNDLEDLIRSCNASKKNVCFLFVRRILTPIKGSEFSVFLNDTLTDINERNRFVAKANPFTKDKTVLTQLAARPANECEVIDFPLAINEAGYNSDRVLNYIQSYVTKLQEDQIRFATFSAIIYYYTQKSTSEVIFRSLFPTSLAHSLRKLQISDQFIRKILVQEFDVQSRVYRDYWRPRFSKFAEGILKSTIGGAHPENWKDHINLYATEFVKVFKANNEYLVEETRGILKSLFFERNNEDLLGTAEQWNSPVVNEQFSFLLRDIGDKQKQKELLISLVEAYPDENHFSGHLGRFLYEKAGEENEFLEAEKYIKQALGTGDGHEDYNLQHLGGMCFRRRLEFLQRTSRNFSVDNVIELTDQASVYFNASRAINTYNIHAYVAQIQTLILAIDMGKEISTLDDKILFVAEANNRWFLEQLTTVRNLIDQAQVIIEQQETLGKTTKILKAKNYVNSGEGRYFELLGNYDSSIATFQKLIQTVERNYRPAMRRMFIESSLLKKVQGDRRKIDNAWKMLANDEITLIEKTINEDILQDTTNIYSLRLWFKLVRYASVDTSVSEILSRLKVWFEHSDDSLILKLESAFYIYVLNALMAIRSDSISQQHKNEANLYIKKCVELSKNTKYNYEYLGIGDGIDAIINHRYRAQIDPDLLDRIDGTISTISSRQSGRIVLPSGLEAFFVPYVGNFVQGIDETAEVTFQLGFRHDGLFAIDVKRWDDGGDDDGREPEPAKNIDTVLPPEIEEDALEPQAIEEVDMDEPQLETREKLPGLKVVDKIDLTNLYEPKNKRNKK